MVLTLCGNFLAGCGANQPPLDMARLNFELSTRINENRLTAYMREFNGSIMISKPVALNTALQTPSEHYGTLIGPADAWTLVFGVAPTSDRVFVNGHLALKRRAKVLEQSHCLIWDYFLPGDVTHPVIKIKSGK